MRAALAGAAGGVEGLVYPAAWLAAILASALVFSVVYWRGGDLRGALIASLLWLKAAALVLWLVGLDRPVFTVYLVGRGGTAVRALTVTANMLVAAALALTNLTVYAWPEISRSLLGRRERLPGVPG